MSNVFLFVQSQFEQASAEKNRFYRFLGNANYNWRLFLSCISFQIHRKIRPAIRKELFFVIDDTITTVTGKLVESASYIYDHASGKTVLGFQKLVLGLFDGSHFIPISNRICSGKKKPVAKSKAKTYKKILVRDLHSPFFPYDWFSWKKPSGVRAALLEHYDEIRTIPAVEGNFIGNMQVGAVSVLVPKHKP